MRESVTKKIPFTLIIGDKERDTKTISYRKYGTEETVNVSKEEFIDLLNDTIKNKN